MASKSTPASPYSPEFGDACAAQRSMLLTHAARLLNNDAELSEDLVQDTLLRALEYHYNFAPGMNLAAWLCKVQFHLFCTQQVQRKAERMLTVSLFERYSHDGALEYHERIAGLNYNEGESNLGIAGLMDQIKALPRELELVIRFRALGYKMEELADMLGVPLTTIKTRLHVARHILSGKALPTGRRPTGHKRAVQLSTEAVENGG